MKKYVLQHEHGEGEDNFYFSSDLPEDQLYAMIDLWGEDRVSPECQKLCDALGVGFEPWRNEFLTLMDFVPLDPDFINLDEQLKENK